jgi:type II secretory pathway pseudopilin PulG
MVSKFFTSLKNKNLSKGITLIEIIVVIFIIILFTMILIVDFPKIQKQFSLSRVTYKLAQDLRRVQDLGLSGVPLYDKDKSQISVKGYGIYIDMISPMTKYVIYADIPDENGYWDQKYSGDQYIFCNTFSQISDGSLKKDCIIDEIDISNYKTGGSPILTIKDVTGNNGQSISGGVSINFMPPNPVTKITDVTTEFSTITIDLDNTIISRKVLVNKAGLIDVNQ